MEPGDADYPSGLRVLRTPPRLWLTGSPPPARCIAVVGTRHPDRTGLAVADALTIAAVERGYGIVSGLATGIDTTAHQSALAAGGRTWAVVGSGADVIAAAAADLAATMAEPARGGGILSELEPGTPVSNQALVARDRLQSALSLAVVVIQTDLRSGTMHTARFAIAQARPLVVVSPPAGTDRAGGYWAGNLALTRPDGCDPALLHATGTLARAINDRRPVADLAIGGTGPWPELWELLDAGQPVG
jgi:DNA processing protein